MWHCAVSERRKDNDGRAMQYSSISKGLAITGIVFTFVVGTVLFSSIIVHIFLRQFLQNQNRLIWYKASYLFDLDWSL